MKGSGAPGNRRRAALRSPPCTSGSAAPRWEIMFVALTLLAMLIELCVGYPERLLRAIGHPVTWMGGLIAALDRRLNRDTDGHALRRASGIFTVAILISAAGSV